MFLYSITAVSFSILSWYYVKKNWPFGHVWKIMILVYLYYVKKIKISYVRFGLLQ